MLTLTPLKPEHVAGVSVAPSQQKYQWMFDNPDSLQGAWSAFYGKDLIVVGGGVVVEQKNVMGFVLFTDKITPRRFIALHRVIERLIRDYEAEGLKVFVHVDPSYRQAVRWAKLMGFSPSGEEEFQGRIMQRYER